VKVILLIKAKTKINDGMREQNSYRYTFN